LPGRSTSCTRRQGSRGWAGPPVQVGKIRSAASRQWQRDRRPCRAITNSGSPRRSSWDCCCHRLPAACWYSCRVRACPAPIDHPRQFRWQASAGGWGTRRSGVLRLMPVASIDLEDSKLRGFGVAATSRVARCSAATHRRCSVRRGPRRVGYGACETLVPELLTRAVSM